LQGFALKYTLFLYRVLAKNQKINNENTGQRQKLNLTELWKCANMEKLKCWNLTFLVFKPTVNNEREDDCQIQGFRKKLK